MKTSENKLKIWECALALALCITLCSGLWAQGASQKLSSELVRLHVVAESDSESDQAVKLKVRDAVIEFLEPKLTQASGADEAKLIIEEELPALRAVVRETLSSEGRDCAFTVKLDNESFPMREYDGFALPAGDYASLRIILGAGDGKNWWCVVFPPLCVNSVSAENAFGELSEDSSELITTDDNGGYTLKFHIVEFFQRLRQAIA